MLNITISGYGRMGHEVEAVAREMGHRVPFILDTDKDWSEYGDRLKESDVVIDFSQPQSAVPNIKRCFDLGLPIVTGTTGWHEQLEEVRNLCVSRGQTLFFASNFSIGVNILFDLNKRLAVLLNRQEEYDILLEEIHHVHKLDAPSGTAVKLANDILHQVGRKKKWVNHSSDEEIDIPVISKRQGEETGTHKIIWTSSVDRITLTHEAFNRRGFAIGAIRAAEWVIGKKGFFEMKDLLELKD
jgi:4-hydroxy-tetrahydrodipicolinate reductase